MTEKAFFGDVMEKQDKKAYALVLLKDKYSELGRLPKRSDFDGETVCLIKQKLGPWPRALEAAGLKEPPAVSAKEKSRMKREKSRRNRKKNRQLSALNPDNALSEKDQEEKK